MFPIFDGEVASQSPSPCIQYIIENKQGVIIKNNH